MYFSAATILALPLLAAATAVTRNSSPPADQCSTGSVQCCSSVQSSSSSAVQSLLSGVLGGLIQAALGPITGNVGLTCSPVVGVLTSTSCTSQAACCNGDSFRGLIVLACDPINLSL